MRLYYSDVFELPLPPKHRFPMSKYRLLRERVGQSGLFAPHQILEAPGASDQQLYRVHDRAYVQRLNEGRLSELEIRRIGFPWSPKMVIRSRHSTGASIAAAYAALEFGVGVNLAGGTHHAFGDSGQGYCVFNDVCVAAREVQATRGVGEVLVFDCDVHQGNGTAAITASDPSIFTCSLHCADNFPFRKTNGDLDIELPVGTDDEKYHQALASALDTCLSRCRPDIVFYVAGADPFEGDRLGKLSLTKRGLRRRDEIVFEAFRALGIPVALSMAGGYAPDVNDIVDIHFQTIAVAADCARTLGSS